MTHTRTERERAAKKIEIAIDKLVDLQDMGFGTSEVEETLSKLNGLLHKINSGD